MAAISSTTILDRLKSLHPAEISLGLDRTEDLLLKCGLPQIHLPPVIHVAGTNGKGSTVAMLRAGLESACCRVHTYTSPHLISFHERIALRGDPISEEHLASLLAEVEAINGGEPITLFEVTTCAAMLAFARVHADYTLLEVGMGGRLDATNVAALAPALCILTPISLDHQSFLGDTVAAIAAEKAGILRKGVRAVVGPQAPEALAVIRARAEQVGCELFVCGEDWHVRQVSTEDGAGRILYRDHAGEFELPMPRLAGGHQVENAGMAVAALRLLGYPQPPMERAMRNVVWPGRLQRLTAGPLIEAADGAEVWLDGGHNPAAGVRLAEALSQLLPRRPTVLICAMLTTKDSHGFLSPLLRLVSSRVVTVGIPGERSAFSAAKLAEEAAAVGFEHVSTAASVTAAIRSLVGGEDAGEDGGRRRIVLCGSLYLAGQVLRDNGGLPEAAALRLPPQPPLRPVSAFICLGSNLGHRARHLGQALNALRSCGRVVKTSALYITAPQHIAEQPDFLNGACELHTLLPPDELLCRLKAIEARLGRDFSGVRYGPRVVDLDIATYGEHAVEIAATPVGPLSIPHRLYV